MKSCQNSSGPAIHRTRLSSIELHSEIHWLRLSHSSRILEIWSGDWMFLELLKMHGYKDIHWFDKNPRNKNKNLPVTKWYLEYLPFDDNSFDAIVSHLVFDSYLYWSDIARILTQVHRVLRADWTYFASEPIESDELIRITKTIRPRANSIISWWINSWNWILFIPSQK